MIDYITSIEFEKQSFWFGFIAGAIFIWFVYRLSKYLPRAINVFKQKYVEIREGFASNAELRYRNETLYHLQKMHITSKMFSLDEIVIPPRFTAPPGPIDLDSELQSDNIINLTIPYLPDWSELAANYKAPTLTFTEALSKGANLVIIGQPGSGRTVALAYLGSLLVRKEINDIELSNLLPIYIHAQEINQDDAANSLLNSVINITSKHLSIVTQKRLLPLLNSTFEKNRALLLIDGLDEVSANQYQVAQNFIRDIHINYPKLRIVATSSPENISGLIQLGLIPISIASWGEDAISAFLKIFNHQWRKLQPPNKHFAGDDLDTVLIQSWLTSHHNPQNPLEITLRTWSAFAGDSLGPDLTANIEAYLQRTTSEYPNARYILGQIIIQTLLSQKFSIDQEEIHLFIKKHGKGSNLTPGDLNESPETVQNPNGAIAEKEETSRDIDIQSLIQACIHTGLLVSIDQHIYSFSHPIIACYLAGSSIASKQDVSFFLEQSDWAGKNLAIAYYLHFNEEAENIVDIYIDWDNEDLLHKRILTAARWLKNGTSNSRWRQKLMRYLAIKMQSESVTLGLSSRFLSALALTHDPHVSPLFRQLLSSEDANLRQLAALGCGLIRDIKSVIDISKLINDIIPAVSRAACLALVAIGDKNALETVATVLVQGSEMAQRYAAEALANHIEEGHPALRDGSKMDDLLIRRAVVFGLARINETWAVEILEKLQLEDQQWLVRNAAIQALENRNRPKSYIPTPSIPLTDTPWLIEFASKLGIGVAPGKPAIDLLIRALRDGDEGLRLEALNYLRINGFEEVIPTIVEVYQRSLGEVREAAFDTLWYLSASGFDINPRI